MLVGIFALFVLFGFPLSLGIAATWSFSREKWEKKSLTLSMSAGCQHKGQAVKHFYLATLVLQRMRFFFPRLWWNCSPPSCRTKRITTFLISGHCERAIGWLPFTANLHRWIDGAPSVRLFVMTGNKADVLQKSQFLWFLQTRPWDRDKCLHSFNRTAWYVFRSRCALCMRKSARADGWINRKLNVSSRGFFAAVAP